MPSDWSHRSWSFTARRVQTDSYSIHAHSSSFFRQGPIIPAVSTILRHLSFAGLWQSNQMHQLHRLLLIQWKRLYGRNQVRWLCGILFVWFKPFRAREKISNSARRPTIIVLCGFTSMWQQSHSEGVGSNILYAGSIEYIWCYSCEMDSAQMRFGTGSFVRLFDRNSSRFRTWLGWNFQRMNFLSFNFFIREFWINAFDSFLFQISSPRWVPTKLTRMQKYTQISVRQLARPPVRRRNTPWSSSPRKINTQSKRRNGFSSR